MVDDAKSVDESVRFALNNIIGGKVVHTCICNDNLLNNGFAFVVEKGKKQYTINVNLPEDVYLDDCLETMTYDI